jgi:ABC exporter DevB family membrane fusion protein
MMRKLVTIVGIVVLVLIGAVGAWTGWSRRGAEPVVVASVGTVAQTVVATGRVAPVTEVVIANKIPGRIKAVLVKEGDVVRRGQPVVQFDDHEAQADLRTMEARVTGARAEVRRAQASVEAARARWTEIKAAARPQEVERARADVLQAKERWDNAELERTRFDQLLKNGHVARQQRDAVATEAEVAKARLRAAQETLSLVQAGAKAETVAAAWAQVQETEGELRRAESQVPLAIAELDRARATLRTGTVESTLNGKVTKKMVEPGEAVDIGTPLMVLADVSRVVVKAEIDETDVGKLRMGQNANVTSDAFPGRVFPATIYEIGQAVGKRKIRPDDLVKIGDMKVLETKLEVTAGGEDLKLGMTVDVRVLVAQKDKVLVIPKHLVQVGKKEAVVAVKGPNGLDNRKITLGIWDDARVEVTGGLSPGDRIVVRRPPTP